MNPHYETVALRAARRCEYCHAPEIIFNFPFEVEHIIPISLGGLNNESNLALACRSCNLYKASHTTGIIPKNSKEIVLFHPRTDNWAQHFSVNLVNAEIIGLTETGIATITRLRINKPSQIIARKQWMILGIFP